MNIQKLLGFALAGIIGAAIGAEVVERIEQPKYQRLQSDKFNDDYTITKLNMQITDLSAKTVGAEQSMTSSLQQITQQRDDCLGKFQRATILYDVSLFGPVKTWVIPADVEPIIVTGRRGTYSHYDPKTQTETVQFAAKPPHN